MVSKRLIVGPINAFLAGYLGKVREALPFANGAMVTKLVNEAFTELLGPKTEADEKMKEERKKTAASMDNSSLAQII